MSSSICEFSFSCRDEFLEEFNSDSYKTRQWLHYSNVPHSPEIEDDKEIFISFHSRISEEIFPLNDVLGLSKESENWKNEFQKEEFCIEDYQDDWNFLSQNDNNDDDENNTQEPEEDDGKGASFEYLQDLVIPWIQLVVKKTQFPQFEEFEEFNISNNSSTTMGQLWNAFGAEEVKIQSKRTVSEEDIFTHSFPKDPDEDLILEKAVEKDHPTHSATLQYVVEHIGELNPAANEKTLSEADFTKEHKQLSNSETTANMLVNMFQVRLQTTMQLARGPTCRAESHSSNDNAREKLRDVPLSQVIGVYSESHNCTAEPAKKNRRLHIPIETPKEIVCPAESVENYQWPQKESIFPIKFLRTCASDEHSTSQWNGSSFVQVCSAISEEHEMEWTQPSAIFRIPQKHLEITSEEKTMLKIGKAELNSLLEQISARVLGIVEFPAFEGNNWLLKEEMPFSDPSLLPAPSLSAEMWLDMLIASRSGMRDLYQTLDSTCKPLHSNAPYEQDQANELTYSSTVPQEPNETTYKRPRENQAATTTECWGQPCETDNHPRSGASNWDVYSIYSESEQLPKKRRTMGKTSNTHTSSKNETKEAWAEQFLPMPINSVPGVDENNQIDSPLVNELVGSLHGHKQSPVDNETREPEASAPSRPVIISLRLMQDYDFINVFEDQGYRCIPRKLDHPIDIIYDESSCIALCEVPQNSQLENGVLPSNWKNFVLHIVKSAQKFKKITVVIITDILGSTMTKKQPSLVPVYLAAHLQSLPGNVRVLYSTRKSDTPLTVSRYIKTNTSSEAGPSAEWMLDTESEHERFLSYFPMFNHYSAQRVLSTMPLSKILQGDMQTLETILGCCMNRELIRMFHNICRHEFKVNVQVDGLNQESAKRVGMPEEAVWADLAKRRLCVEDALPGQNQRRLNWKSMPDTQLTSPKSRRESTQHYREETHHERVIPRHAPIETNPYERWSHTGLRDVSPKSRRESTQHYGGGTHQERAIPQHTPIETNPYERWSPTGLRDVVQPHPDAPLDFESLTQTVEYTDEACVEQEGTPYANRYRMFSRGNSQRPPLAMAPEDSHVKWRNAAPVGSTSYKNSRSPGVRTERIPIDFEAYTYNQGIKSHPASRSSFTEVLTPERGMQQRDQPSSDRRVRSCYLQHRR